MVSMSATRIVVATRPVDFRKGHDGLESAIKVDRRLRAFCAAATRRTCCASRLARPGVWAGVSALP